MDRDMTVPCEDGLINLRVGAIIMKNGKILMVGNNRAEYLYSVGGRIKFGETSEEAVVREWIEEKNRYGFSKSFTAMWGSFLVLKPIRVVSHRPKPTHDKSYVKNVTYGRCIGTISIIILLM